MHRSVVDRVIQLHLANFVLSNIKVPYRHEHRFETVKGNVRSARQRNNRPPVRSLNFSDYYPLNEFSLKSRSVADFNETRVSSVIRYPHADEEMINLSSSVAIITMIPR